MLNRLTLLMKTYELSPSQLADAIGVQRSNISHLLAGRNNPSLDFVTRLLNKFPEVSAEWLLFGKGQFQKKNGGTQTDLFQMHTENKTELPPSNPVIVNPKAKVQDIPAPEEVSENMKSRKSAQEPVKTTKSKNIKQIVVLYEDGSFEAYKPSD